MLRSIVAALALCIAAPAFGQQRCGPAATLHEWFADSFGERVVFTGTTADGGLLMFFVNDETGSWTIAVTDGNIACLVASGQSATMKPMGISL